MKKLLIIIALLPVVLFGQDFEWNNTINGSDSTLDGNSNYKLIDVDFDINLTYLPLKSIAKILLYNTDTIPLVTWFWNLNYADTLYVQVAAHEIGIDSIETIERRITRIAHYSAPTTDGSFTGTAKDPSAVWVDPINGDDGTGTGTEANPYKTIAHVESLVLTSQTNIYVKSGSEVFS